MTILMRVKTSSAVGIAAKGCHTRRALSSAGGSHGAPSGMCRRDAHGAVSATLPTVSCIKGPRMTAPRLFWRA
jgi:hypothetical protein